MNSNIITKFTIGTEQGLSTLLFLTQTIAREKLLPLLPKEQVENYLSENFSGQALTVELNSMSNQWLVVYDNDKPAGFARITSKGERPEVIANKRAIRIADFGVLKEYDDPAIMHSLFDKCWSVCKAYEAIWINEYAENPFIPFFESEGFTRLNEEIVPEEFFLPGVTLIKQS